ncbi:MAG: two-component system phosphate regulon sensor histidine kinase PhoR [Cyclobacteriaceae bacterium]|jgi:two-component system phosphate regulon sensor histidine kinase PhoR
MRKKTSRLFITIILLIVFPMLAFFSFQLSTANENEQIINDVYEEQLSSVLFSVNQYSNDFISSLMDRVAGGYDPVTQWLNKEVDYLITKDGFESYLITSIDTESNINLNAGQSIDTTLQTLLIKNCQENTSIRKRLLAYKQQGYRKMEPVGLIIDHSGISYQVIMVILTVDQQNYLFAGAIDPLKFIGEVLSPKMQQIASQQLILTLQKKTDQVILYSTDAMSNNLLVTSKLWLFPDYLLGVSPKSVTIKGIIKERRNQNLIAIGVLFLMMTIGLLMIFQNIRLEYKLNQTKSDFVSNVSHEIRTPLALIRMFSETLLLGRVKDGEKHNEYLEIIFKETNRLTNIVNRILNFSKIEAEKRKYQLAPIDLTTLVKEVFSDYSYHLESNGFTWSQTLPDQQQLIRGDREAIYEAMIIIIDNAMKYSDEKKHIEVLISQEKNAVIIGIQDQGIGIASDRLDQIFDKFYRVADNDRYFAQGAGLGLSILKHIMDAHFGEIEVDSQPDKGSIFKLIFKKEQVDG